MTVDHIAPFGAALNNRILLVADDSCVARLLAYWLATAGCLVTRASTSDDDLFTKALDHDTVVYLPTKGFLDSRSREDPMIQATNREVLGAANAPGVSLLVTILPANAREDVLEEAIQRSGIPYFIVRTPALIEELRVELADEVPDTVWVPQCDGVAFGEAKALLSVVLRCLRDERQGSILQVPATVTDVPTALRRALPAGENRVIAVWPPIFQMGRIAARMMRGRDTRDVQVIDTLLANRDESEPSPRRAA